ncbi:MAG: long-chain-fatty-acid--CoA ligase [Terriglobia bacterium]
MILPLTPVRFIQRARSLWGRKTGVVCGSSRFTYQEFSDRCDRLSSALLGLGAKPGDRVAYLSQNCHRLLEAYYGVPAVGAVLMPLNTRLAPSELLSIVENAAPRLLFFSSELAAQAEALARHGAGTTAAICLDGPALPWAFGKDYDALIQSEAPAQIDWTALDENATAEMFYTSGTTAAPKGVMLTHRNLYLHALSVAQAQKLGDDDVGTYAVPLFHVNSWGAPHTLTLSGARHVILPKCDAALMADLIERERITRLQMVPSMVSTLIAHPDFERHDVSSVREVMIGGAPSNIALIRRVEEKFPGAVVAGGYGLTETSPVATIAYIKDHLTRDSPEAVLRRKASAGYVITGTEAMIVDSSGRALPADGDTVGELLIRSDTVMAGYRNDLDETMSVLRDGWLHTGDLAIIDDEGYVLVVDRLKDMVLSGGENIATAEVERAISDHPDVLECAVIAVPDERWGEVPKALITLRSGSRATEDDIIRHCRASLAGFKVPKSVEFRESLPKGGTGKILKRQLREPYWAGRERQVN